MYRILSLLALAAMVFFGPGEVGAQEPLIPRPIDANAPAAQRARAVADLVLAGDQQKLESYLKENAAPAYAGSATLGGGGGD